MTQSKTDYAYNGIEDHLSISTGIVKMDDNCHDYSRDQHQSGKFPNLPI